MAAFKMMKVEISDREHAELAFAARLAKMSIQKYLGMALRSYIHTTARHEIRRKG
tara:strand:- start:2185 stop:2349 length:165 start_codon:yes stop_codon:yes gene_type:complete